MDNKNIFKIQTQLKSELKRLAPIHLKRTLTQKEKESVESIKIDYFTGKFNIDYKESTEDFNELLKEAIRNVIPNFLAGGILKDELF